MPPGRPRTIATDTPATEVYALRMTPKMRAWVRDRGGAGYLRRLIREDRQRQSPPARREAESPTPVED